MQSAVLTVKEVAGRLRIGLSTVYELFDDGSLRGFRLRGARGAIRVYEESLAEFIQKNENRPEPEPEPKAAASPRPRPRLAIPKRGRIVGPPRKTS